MRKLFKSLEEYYEEKDSGYNTPCWIWKGSIKPKGYGVYYSDGQMHQAHRFVYEKYKGKIGYRLVLDHLCKVRKCVNPEHLEAVSSRVNNQRAGIMTLNTANDIRKFALTYVRVSNREIAKRYNVSRSVIDDVLNNKRWLN